MGKNSFIVFVRSLPETPGQHGTKSSQIEKQPSLTDLFLGAPRRFSIIVFTSFDSHTIFVDSELQNPDVDQFWYFKHVRC